MIFREGANLQIVVNHRELLPLASGIGVLVSGHVQIEGSRYRKWLLVTSGPDVTAAVHEQARDDTKEAYPDAAMRESLASVALRPPPLDEQLSLLPFRLGELAWFRIMRVLSARAMRPGPTRRASNCISSPQSAPEGRINRVTVRPSRNAF